MHGLSFTVGTSFTTGMADQCTVSVESGRLIPQMQSYLALTLHLLVGQSGPPFTTKHRPLEDPRATAILIQTILTTATANWTASACLPRPNSPTMAMQRDGTLLKYMMIDLICQARLT